MALKGGSTCSQEKCEIFAEASTLGTGGPVVSHFKCSRSCRFSKDDLIKYMEKALMHVPERSSGSGSQGSSRPVSSASGSTTPNAELRSAAASARGSARSTPRRPAPTNVSSACRAHRDVGHTSFDQRNKTDSARSTGSKGRVSFETDVSLQTPGVVPLNLPPPSSSDSTPVGSTPDDSPRFTFDPWVKHRSAELKFAEPQLLGKAELGDRSSSAPKLLESGGGVQGIRKSKSTLTNLGREKDRACRQFESGVPREEPMRKNDHPEKFSAESFIPSPEKPRSAHSQTRDVASWSGLNLEPSELELSSVSTPSDKKEVPFNRTMTLNSKPGNQSFTGVVGAQQVGRVLSSRHGVCEEISLPNTRPILSDLPIDFWYTAPQTAKFSSFGRQDSEDTSRDSLFQSCDGASKVAGASDAESVQSDVSCSSISSFRQALQARIHTDTQTRRRGRLKSVQTVAPGSALFDVQRAPQSSSTDAPAAVQKPVPMMTRHTQMPSPAPSKQRQVSK